MFSGRRSIGIAVLFLAALATSACATETLQESATADHADEALPDDLALFKALGCTVEFDEGSETEGNAGATIHPCTGDAMGSATEPRSTFVYFDSEGAKALYIADARDSIESRGLDYRQVIGDGPWSVWGTDSEVLAAAVDEGGTLDD